MDIYDKEADILWNAKSKICTHFRNKTTINKFKKPIVCSDNSNTSVLFQSHPKMIAFEMKSNLKTKVSPPNIKLC